jgi:hypothetical protein
VEPPARHGFAPIDGGDPIRLAANFEAQPHEVREWIRGFYPLFQDPRVYFSTVPENEYTAAAEALAAWQKSGGIIITTEPEEEQ